MKELTEEIKRIREGFRAFIILKDITFQAAAELVGWKRAGSVYKFLAGKHVPNARRLYRIKKLLESQGTTQSEARGVNQ